MKTERVKVSDLTIDPKLTAMRPINMMFVSRFRQAYRVGTKMPTPIVEAGTYRVVSGNHRVTAMRMEYGDDYEVKVDVREYDSERAVIEEFARENVPHGNPLEGVSRKKIAVALVGTGATNEELSELFCVPVRRIIEWCGMTVTVVGKRSKKTRTEVIKRGPDIIGETITEDQYESHMKRDRGVTAYSQAEQLSRWLRNGWIKATDLRSIEALEELSGEITTFLSTIANEKESA